MTRMTHTFPCKTEIILPIDIVFPPPRVCLVMWHVGVSIPQPQRHEDPLPTATTESQPPWLLCGLQQSMPLFRAPSMDLKTPLGS